MQKKTIYKKRRRNEQFDCTSSLELKTTKIQTTYINSCKETDLHEQ